MIRRTPSLHFALIGAGLFLLFGRGGDDTARRARERTPIVIAASDIELLREEWTRQHGSPPAASAEKQLIEDAIDEEILYREAVAQQLDEQAAVVRDRLARLASFVDESAGEDTHAGAETARRLGLQERDVVIRRYLVQAMRAALAHVVPSASIGEDELRAYYDAHRDDFVQPHRRRLTHVYVSGQRPRAQAELQATRLIEQLRQAGTPPQEAAAFGDPFVRGAELGSLSDEELQRLFGAGFTAAVQALPSNTWSGPLVSAYGLHLVWVHEHEQSAPAALAHVRGQLLHRYLAEQRERQLRSRLDRLRAMYSVRVERP